MLSIFATTKYHSSIYDILNKEDRLVELVEVLDNLAHKPTPNGHSILIKNGEIAFPLDWYNVQPPFLLPEEIELNEHNLLGIIFAKLNNYEKAYEYLQAFNPSLFKELDFINRLQQGIAIDPQELISQYSPFEEYRLMHNHGILRHYATNPENFDLEKTLYFYEEYHGYASNDILQMENIV